MTEMPDALRELLATGPLATVVTVDPDGTPHATLGWAGFDGDEIVMATFFYLQQRKLQNVRRDAGLSGQGVHGSGAVAVCGGTGPGRPDHRGRRVGRNGPAGRVLHRSGTAVPHA